MNKHHLIAVGGLSGTGKSTLARKLAADFAGAVWLRSDAIRKELCGVAPDTKLPASAYSSEVSGRTYDELFRRATEAAGQGRDVVIDMVFARLAQRRQAAKVAAENGALFTGFWLQAAPETMRCRVDARTGDVSDADSAVVDLQLGYDVGMIDWHVLDAEQEPEAVLQQARVALIY